MAAAWFRLSVLRMIALLGGCCSFSQVVIFIIAGMATTVAVIAAEDGAVVTKSRCHSC